MTLFNALQLVLAAVALGMIARRLRTLLFDAPLDTDAFLDALRIALSRSQLELAQRIAESCAPAWPARLVASAMAELQQGRPAHAVVDEAYLPFRQALFRGHEPIAALGRMASPVALIGVVLELGDAFHGGGGLLALQRGLVMRVALERSLFTFALGLATSVVCLFAVSILQRSARLLDRELKRVAAALEQIVARPRDM